MVITLRDSEEIQFAHDLLHHIVNNEKRFSLLYEQRIAITSSLDVLCWVLNHEHNPDFADNLRKLKQQLESHGYKIFTSSTPFDPESMSN